MGARAQIPDLPPTPFTAIILSAVGTTAIGGSFSIGTYFLQATLFTPWGESLPSAEVAVILSGGQNAITVSVTQNAPTISTLVTKLRIYLGTISGAENAVLGDITTFVAPITFLLLSNAGIPPSRSTAYNPDMDGPQFGASTVFGWLNEGLKKLSRITGGLLDYAGVPTKAGNPLYVLPGEWLKITDVWYGGYWVQGGKRGDFFRRNTVNSQILTGVVISIFTDRQVIETSYQPDRNAGVTTTTASMLATDTSVPIANSAVFLLPFGFAMIGTEIVAYSQLGANMSGLIRGVGSASPAVAWPSGTVVTELPLFWCGRRVFGTTYSPGQSALNLPVPDGWDAILKLYLLGCARDSELDRQAAKDLFDQFKSEGEAWMASYKGVASFVQVGGANTTQVFAPTPAGGLILP